MEKNPFSEANNYSADKEITFILHDFKADNCSQKPTSRLFLTSEESSPHPHTQFLQYTVLQQ
jgi:hypothetical protein